MFMQAQIRMTYILIQIYLICIKHQRISPDIVDVLNIYYKRGILMLNIPYIIIIHLYIYIL